MEANDLLLIQDQIGYRFKNPDLLQQAFIRRSYSEENGGENNEVLEFIGDKVLDFVVVKLLAEKYGSFSGEHDGFSPEKDFNEFTCCYQENRLTELKKKLVEKKTLARQMDFLHFADFLIMGNGDIKKDMGKEDSVKEDLFEAIIGSVTLDSSWDIAEIQSVVEFMLNPERYLSGGMEDDFVGLIQEWTIKKYNTIPLYHLQKASMSASWYEWFDGISTTAKPDCRFSCLLKLGEMGKIFRGFGKSKSEARKDVCKLAYTYLQKNSLLFSIQDEIDNPSREESINQLEILARRGYFAIPTYTFSQKYDKNGSPVWQCGCQINKIEKTFHSEATSKKDAKKNAAFKMLRYVLDNPQKKSRQ